MSTKLFPIHFSRGGEKFSPAPPPLVTGLVSILNDTRCKQHDCTAAKAMDATYLLIIV